jgi:hypothetical protein
VNPQNTGSFGAAIGGISPELQAAIQGRAGNPNAGATQQVSGAAPTSNPTTQVPPPPTVLPQQPGMTNAGSGAIGTSLTGGGEEGMGSQPLTNAGQAPATALAPYDPSNVKTILSAMHGFLKTVQRLSGDTKV